MSSKGASRRPGNKVMLETKEPRELSEITKEYQELIGRAGNLQYQLFVFQDELSKVNDRLVEINHEAAARQNLDKEKQKETTDASPDQKA